MSPEIKISHRLLNGLLPLIWTHLSYYCTADWTRMYKWESQNQDQVYYAYKSPKVPSNILHHSFQLQHENHDTHDGRQASTDNPPCGASSHHCLLGRRNTGASGLHRCQAQCLGRSAVSEAMAGAWSGVVDRWRRGALVSSGWDRNDRKSDGAVQFCRHSGDCSSLLVLLGRAGLRAFAPSWRVGTASFVLGRAGRARTGADGLLRLGGSRAAATILRRRGRNGVATLGDGAHGRGDGNGLRGHGPELARTVGHGGRTRRDRVDRGAVDRACGQVLAARKGPSRRGGDRDNGRSDSLITAWRGRRNNSRGNRNRGCRNMWGSWAVCHSWSA